MKLNYELAIALRYLKTRRHGAFAMITTMIAIGGVTLGVAALIVTLSVMSGFRTDIQDKTLGVQPHIVLLGTQKDSDFELNSLAAKTKIFREVEAVSPFILGQTLIKTRSASQGVVLRGIVPSKEFAVTNVKRSLVSGDWKSLEEGTLPSLVLGAELAKTMGVVTDDEILVFSPSETASVGVMGQIPKVEKFKVGGIFRSGMYEYDSNLAFISLGNAQRLFNMKGATGLGIRLVDLDAADLVAEKIGRAAGAGYWARSWQDMNRNLFEALKLEKIVMTIILTMIILVASFTIISNLILMSIEKSKDIGILRALGAGRNAISRIFLYCGMVLGTTGILLGTGLGVGIATVLKKTQWIKLPQDVYYIDTLPIKLSGFDITMVLVAAFAITILASVYPARQAAKVDPVEAIRYG
jgi:lipoprotein-releasing system permease protein